MNGSTVRVVAGVVSGGGIARLGLDTSGPIVVQTIRRRYLTLPGRITPSARRWTLHLPARWPWRHGFGHALARLRAIPLLA